MPRFLVGVIGAILTAIVHVYMLVGFALIACIALLLAFLVPVVIKASKVAKIIGENDEKETEENAGLTTSPFAQL